MSQNSIIAFGLLVGFLVFITIRGELGQYLTVIGLASSGSQTVGPKSSTPTRAAAVNAPSTESGLPPLPSLPSLSI